MWTLFMIFGMLLCTPYTIKKGGGAPLFAHFP